MQSSQNTAEPCHLHVRWRKRIGQVHTSSSSSGRNLCTCPLETTCKQSRVNPSPTSSSKLESAAAEEKFFLRSFPITAGIAGRIAVSPGLQARIQRDDMHMAVSIGIN